MTMRLCICQIFFELLKNLFGILLHLFYVKVELTCPNLVSNFLVFLCIVSYRNNFSDHLFCFQWHAVYSLHLFRCICVHILHSQCIYNLYHNESLQHVKIPGFFAVFTVKRDFHHKILQFLLICILFLFEVSPVNIT